MSVGKLLSLVALLAVVACPVVAQADIAAALSLDGVTNRIDFVNREVIVRRDGDNYNVVNPLSTPIQAGDFVVSAFRGQDLTVLGNSTPSWTAGTQVSATPYFSGYSVTEVVSTFGAVVYKAPTWDPFGKLNVANGETLALFDDANDWAVDGVTLVDECGQRHRWFSVRGFHPEQWWLWQLL